MTTEYITTSDREECVEMLVMKQDPGNFHDEFGADYYAKYKHKCQH